MRNQASAARVDWAGLLVTFAKWQPLHPQAPTGRQAYPAPSVGCPMPRRDSAEPAGESKSRLEVPFMPDRRRVAAKAIIAAGAYLHPNFYVGDQDKKLWQIQSDAPITDMDANFLESWMWAKHPSLAAALENSIFEALEDTTIA
jgi:hypothetical protein